MSYCHPFEVLQSKETMNCPEKVMKISHFNQNQSAHFIYIKIELCYFSLDQWEIRTRKNAILLRTDEEREINHHGRPVEVGEVETGPGSSSDKVEGKIYLLMPDFYRKWSPLLNRWFLFLRRTWLQWMRRFSWRLWKATMAGGKI